MRPRGKRRRRDIGMQSTILDGKRVTTAPPGPTDLALLRRENNELIEDCIIAHRTWGIATQQEMHRWEQLSEHLKRLHTRAGGDADLIADLTGLDRTTVRAFLPDEQRT